MSDESTDKLFDPDLTDRLLQPPLRVAQKILSAIASASLRPIGRLIWKLRAAESGKVKSPAQIGNGPVVSGGAEQRSAQPAASTRPAAREA